MLVFRGVQLNVTRIFFSSFKLVQLLFLKSLAEVRRRSTMSGDGDGVVERVWKTWHQKIQKKHWGLDVIFFRK